MSDSSNLSVFGKESYFNENVTFFKNVNIGSLLEVSDIASKSGKINVAGNVIFSGPANFLDNVDIDQDLTVSNLLVRKRLDVGIGGTILTTSTGNIGIGTDNPRQKLDVIGTGIFDTRVGIGSIFPQQKLDVAGSIKIDKEIYDSLNSPGSVGGFLSKDAQGIKWVTFQPAFSEGIFVYNDGVLIGVGSFRGLNFTSGINTNATSTDVVQAYVSPLNPNLADIVISDYWGVNGSNEIYRFSNVGINTNNPNTTLDVRGNAYISSGLGINATSPIATLDVRGTAYISNRIVGDGSISIGGTAEFGDYLRVNNGITAFNGLNVASGVSTFINSVGIGGNLLTLGNSYLTGITTVVSNFIVGGQTNLNSNLIVSGITNLYNALYVNAAAFIQNNLVVSSTQQSTSKDTGAVVVEGGVGIEKNLNIGGSFNVLGSSILSSSLFVGGETTFVSNVSIGGDTLLFGTLGVSGATTLNGSLDVGGIANFYNNLYGYAPVELYNTLYVQDNTTLGNNLTVNGFGFFNNELTTNELLTVNGPAIINDTLNVNNVADFNNAINVNGSANINSNLVVSGLSTFVGLTTFNNDVYIGGDLYIRDDLIFDEFIARNANLTNNLNVAGISTFNVVRANTLNVSGISTFQTRVNVGTGGTIITVDQLARIGFGTAVPSREIDFNRDLRLREALYDTYNNVGYKTEFYQVPRSVLTTVGLGSDGKFIGGRFFDAANLIRLNLDFIAEEAVGYIISNDYKSSPTFTLSSGNYTSCKDDIKDILKAITIDMTKGGNVQSIGAGLSYYSGNTLIHINGTDVNGYSIREASIAAIGAASTIARYVINNLPPPKSYQPRPISGINADAARLIEKNKDFIAAEAVDRTKSAYPSLVIPGGNQNCIDDIKLILDAIIWNIQFGGNDRVFDAAKFYLDNPALLSGEQVESVYAYQRARDVAIQVIRNQTVTKISGILNTFTQYKDLTIIVDPIVPTCQNQASAITSFVGIVTNAIGIGTLPTNRTVGVTSVRQIKDLTLQDDPTYSSNMNPNGCSNVASAIHTYAGIVTTIIGRGPAFSPSVTEPDGKVIWAPPGADSKNTIWVTKYGNDDNGGRTEGDAKLTIAAAVAIAEPGDTIFVRPGIYYENNPIGLRRDVAISGQDLRLVSVIPLNLGKDLFHVRRGCLIENMNFTLETGQQNIGAAVVAFPPTPEDVLAGIAYSAISGYTAPGPADEGPSGRWRSPYVRNCTNFMDRSIGMKIDGNHATGSTLGADLKCMVLDSFTQYNEAGIGVSITNEGYAQLVSLFTIACDKAVYVTSGGQCDLTNSNSSFGNYGLYADGLGPLQFSAQVQTAVDQEGDIFVFRNVSDKINNPRRPYDGQALYFKVPVNGVPIEAPFEQLESVIVTNGGSGYNSSAPPNIVVRDADGTVQPKGLEGIIAEVSPTIDDVTGQITSIDVINSGRNYLSTQNIIIDIEGNGGAVAVAKMSPIYYTVNSATVPTEPNGRYADAVNLIMRNRDFIAAEAVDRMLYYYNVTLGTPFSVPTGSQSCIDDVKLVLKAVAYNLQFGGNDQTYDAAFVYYTNSYLNGEEEQSIYTYQVARDLAKSIINNVTIAKRNYTSVNTFTQVFDYTIVPDPLTGSNTSPSSCADVRSTIDNLVGIVTFAIRAVSPSLPASRTVGNTVGISTVTLNEFVPYPVGAGVSVEMFKISRILTSGHSFEFIGAGTNINSSVPQQGGVPIKANEVVAINGAQIPYTSTDQAGNFNIGGGIQISQTTASISGRDFNRSIQAQVTPLILALS